MRRGSITAFAGILGVVVVLRAGLNAAHAEGLTRQAAIQRALRQNPQIAAARARESRAKAVKGQADAARWPQITISVGAGPSLKADLVEGTAVQSTESAYDVSFDDLTATFGAQAGILQPLYTFGKIEHRREAAAHGLEAQQAQTQMTRAEVALEVARLYEGYLFAREAKRFFEEVDRMLEPSIQRTEERLASGKPDVSEEDLLQLESARSVARVQLHRAEATLKQAEGGIRAYLGMRSDEPFAMEEQGLEAIAVSPPSYDELIGQAKAHRPELLALREGAAALHQLAQAEEAGHYPDFFALATASGAYTPGRDLVETRYFVDPLFHFVPNLIVGVRWQFQGDMAAQRAAEQRAAATALQNRRQWAFDGIPAEVRRAYEDVQRARKDIDETQTGVERAKRWIVRATADYTMGLAESRQVTDALEAYATLRMQEIESRYRYNVSMAELAKAAGALAGTGKRLYPGEAAGQTATRSQPPERGHDDET